MNKIGILTFQFAHNYGAMLQAYALKGYIKKMDINCELIPYYPVHFQGAYEISPLSKGSSFKHKLGNILHYFKRKDQYQLFNNFKYNELYESNVTNEIDSFSQISSYCGKFNTVIFGSDQIWNTDINYNDSVYFGATINCKKISYAASMGKKTPVDKQVEYVRKYLSSFHAISVREPDSQVIIKKIANLDAEVVCDPVFLLTKNEWVELEQSVAGLNKPYILIYVLEENEELLKQAKELASENNWNLYSIHPTLGIKFNGIQQLTKVGPKEFLYLIHHAEAVCTNSFHAVSFSVIYKKRLLHIPNSKSPERTVSLLRLLKLNSEDGIDVDLNQCDYTNLEKTILRSKEFIKANLE